MTIIERRKLNNYIKEGKIKEHFNEIIQTQDDALFILMLKKVLKLKENNVLNVLLDYERFKIDGLIRPFIIDNIGKCTNYDMFEAFVDVISESIMTMCDRIICELRMFKYDGHYIDPILEISKKMNFDNRNIMYVLIRQLIGSNEELKKELDRNLNINGDNRKRVLKFNLGIRTFVLKYLNNFEDFSDYDLEEVLRSYYCLFYTKAESNQIAFEEYNINENDIIWASEILKQNGIVPSKKVLLHFFRCTQEKGSYDDILSFYKMHIEGFYEMFGSNIENLKNLYPVIEPYSEKVYK